MIAEPVGDRLDEARAFAVAGCGNGLLSRGTHRHRVTPIDLLASEPGGDGLLRQRFAASLQSQRHRNSPLVVGGDEHDRQFVHTGKIHRFVNIAFRGGAVAEHTNGDTRFPPQLERIGDACSMRCL